MDQEDHLFMRKENEERTGPSMKPCGTPTKYSREGDLTLLTTTHCYIGI